MPSLKNVWVNPKTRVIADDGQTAIVEVDGMLCEWGWARNVKAALAGLEGVESVDHEAETDIFVVRHREPLSAAAQAVDRVVIARWARRGLEKLGASLTRSDTK